MASFRSAFTPPWRFDHLRAVVAGNVSGIRSIVQSMAINLNSGNLASRAGHGNDNTGARHQYGAMWISEKLFPAFAKSRQHCPRFAARARCADVSNLQNDPKLFRCWSGMMNTGMQEMQIAARWIRRKR